jgi:hypothetical protein
MSLKSISIRRLASSADNAELNEKNNNKQMIWRLLIRIFIPVGL